MNLNDKLLLFIDGSVNSETKCGYGAYLAVRNLPPSLEIIKSAIKTRHFADTTSSQLELETLLWALDDLPKTSGKIVVYTDSQMIFALQGRRERLERNDFRTGSSRLRHHELYRQFYSTMDRLDLEIIKVKGHQPARNKEIADRVFALVDRAARKAMKAEKPDGSSEN